MADSFAQAFLQNGEIQDYSTNDGLLINTVTQESPFFIQGIEDDREDGNNGKEVDIRSLSLNYTTPIMALIASLLILFIVVTALGNFLVAVALYRYRHLRTVSNYLIGNLAVSDFLLAVTVLPLSTVNECLGQWVFGRAICNIWLVTDVLCCTASIWNLCVIAFDRFTATLYPVWYREKRSTKQAIIYVGTVWFISTIVCVPPLLGWNDLTDNYVYDNSTTVHQCILFQTPSYVIYSANGSFFLPFLLTLALYVGIFASLRARMRKMRRADSNCSRGIYITATAATAAAARAAYDRTSACSVLLPPAATAEEHSLLAVNGVTGSHSDSTVGRDDVSADSRVVISAVNDATTVGVTAENVTRGRKSRWNWRVRRSDSEPEQEPANCDRDAEATELLPTVTRTASCRHVAHSSSSLTAGGFQSRKCMAETRRHESENNSETHDILVSKFRYIVEQKSNSSYCCAASPGTIVRRKSTLRRRGYDVDGGIHCEYTALPTSGECKPQSSPPSSPSLTTPVISRATRNITSPRVERKVSFRDRPHRTSPHASRSAARSSPLMSHDSHPREGQRKSSPVTSHSPSKSQREDQPILRGRTPQSSPILSEREKRRKSSTLTSPPSPDTSLRREHKLLSSRKSVDRSERRSSAVQRCEQRELRATVRMAIIISAFCLMWLGFFVVYTLRGCCPACSIPRELDAFFFWLGYSNSSINPILYTIFNDDFKRAFFKIIGWRRGQGGGEGAGGRKSSFESVAASRKHSTASTAVTGGAGGPKNHHSSPHSPTAAF